eukprot:Skav215296  [mRNA]  locus=scaffold6542:15802:16731:+ [translate_table: standard]
MEVCSAISGEPLTFCNADEFDGSAKAVKQLLRTRLGIPRFRQRLLVEDGSRVISDDDVLAAVPPVKIQLVLLEFEQIEVGSAAQEIMSACRDNRADTLEDWLRRPINPDLSDEQGRRPLHHAAQNGCLKPIKLLLEADAEKDASDNRGLTSLWVASAEGHLEVVRLLIDASADKNQAAADHGVSPLWVASAGGHLEVVRLLIEAGANKNQAATSHGASPLWVASYQGHLEVVRLLIEAGAGKNQATSDHGASPLQIASYQGHLEIARLLSEVGADKSGPEPGACRHWCIPIGNFLRNWCITIVHCGRSG